MWINSNFFKKRINTAVQREIANALIQKKLEISTAETALEVDYLKNKAIFDSKIVEVKALVEKVNIQSRELNLQIQETQRIRNNAEEEQKKLWERLDILRDSFTADQIWSRLWECAYSKAIDAVWPILEKEIPHLIELAENRAYLKAKQEVDNEYKIQLEGLIKIAGGQEVPKLKILALKKEIHEKMLYANRVKNTDLESRYSAQLELIELLIGG